MSDSRDIPASIAPSVARGEKVEETGQNVTPCQNNSELPRPVTLPPRAKPGRRPATDIPLDKRKAQNRQAQRAFRERKRKREDELQEQMKEMEKKHKAEMAKMKQDLEDAKLRQKQQQNQRGSERLRVSTEGRPELAMRTDSRGKVQPSPAPSSSKADVRRSTSKVKSSQSSESSPAIMPKDSSKTLPAPDAPTGTLEEPRHDVDRLAIDRHLRTLPDPKQPDVGESNNQELAGQSSEDMEIDFTNLGRNPQPSLVLTPNSMTEECGFCTSRSYCVCKDTDVNGPTISRIDSSGHRGGPVEPSAAPNGPGSCKACLEDPERRRICLSMANRSQHSPNSAISPGGHALPNKLPALGVSGADREAPVAPGPSDGMISCADAISWGRELDPNFQANWNDESFLDRLRIRSPSPGRVCGTCNSRGCSAQDVSIASILAAIRNPGLTPSEIETAAIEHMANPIDFHNHAGSKERDETLYSRSTSNHGT